VTYSKKYLELWISIKRIDSGVGSTVPQELIYRSYDKFDFSNLMKMIEISDVCFDKVKYHINNSTHSINILHVVSENFLKFLTETHQALANNLPLRFSIEHMDTNMIYMEFEKPSD
jgi:hypothetical protein